MASPIFVPASVVPTNSGYLAKGLHPCDIPEQTRKLLPMTIAIDTRTRGIGWVISPTAERPHSLAARLLHLSCMRFCPFQMRI